MTYFDLFPNNGSKVGIYKIFLRTFILIAFMVAGYFRQARLSLLAKGLQLRGSRVWR